MKHDDERVHKSPPSSEPRFRTSSINTHTRIEGEKTSANVIAYAA